MSCHSQLPKFIALCGNPKAGKSEVQTILERRFGYQPVDDGHVLRKFAVENLGLSWDDVKTQDGKARKTNILGKNWVNRDILGTLGKQLEDMFGEHILPFIAANALPAAGLYSFGSVRKTQGWFYKQRGGFVIEIARASALPSPYAFDQYDKTCIDATIINDGSLADLEAKVVAAVSELAG